MKLSELKVGESYAYVDGYSTRYGTRWYRRVKVLSLDRYEKASTYSVAWRKAPKGSFIRCQRQKDTGEIIEAQFWEAAGLNRVDQKRPGVMRAFSRIECTWAEHLVNEAARRKDEEEARRHHEERESNQKKRFAMAIESLSEEFSTDDIGHDIGLGSGENVSMPLHLLEEIAARLRSRRP